VTPGGCSALVERLGAGVRARIRRRTLGLMLLALAGALAAAGAGGAATATLPTLYVNYGANCTFSLSVDSQTGVVPVATGSVLLPGDYQVLIESSVLYTSLSAPPCMPQFNLGGPGVNLSIGFTSFGASVPITLAPSGSYVASDAYAPTVTTTFAASATGSSSSLVTTRTSTLPSTSSTSSEDPVGSAIGTGDLAYRGTLAVVGAAGGKLELRFRGKPVNALQAGRYTIVASNRSVASAFVLRKGGQTPVLNGASFSAKRTASLALSVAATPTPRTPTARRSSSSCEADESGDARASRRAQRLTANRSV
jgi:hypothetical protein